MCFTWHQCMCARACVPHIGLSRSSDLAREVLVYLFHGKCAPRETMRGPKRSPIIFALRTQYMHGLNIFSKATQSFQDFIQYLTLVPQQRMGLTDPTFETEPEFICYSERGLRNFASSANHPLGKHAMRSMKDWSQVHAWKKRETWVHVGLTILKTGSLSRWNHFKWSDHQLLQCLHRVFKKKIQPISHGAASGLIKIKDPETWTQVSSEKGMSDSAPKSKKTTSPDKSSSRAHFQDLSSDEEVCFHSQTY